MDVELAEMKEAIARIDERTTALLEVYHSRDGALRDHEQADREDFKELHGRITAVERKQGWILGVGTAIVFVITMAGGFIKTFIGTFLGG